MRRPRPPFLAPHCRERGSALLAEIKAGDEAAALRILKDDPSSTCAWQRDSVTEEQWGSRGVVDPGTREWNSGGRGRGWQFERRLGPYPVHVAVKAGMAGLVEALAAVPGVLQQEDGDLRTPLQLVQRTQKGEGVGAGEGPSVLSAELLARMAGILTEAAKRGTHDVPPPDETKVCRAAAEAAAVGSVGCGEAAGGAPAGATE